MKSSGGVRIRLLPMETAVCSRRRDRKGVAGSTWVPRSLETAPPRTLEQEYAQGPMLVLGRVAVLNERGTPVLCLECLLSASMVVTVRNHGVLHKSAKISHEKE